MATKHPKNSAARSTTARITEARLQRLTHQNEKLSLEIKRLKGEVAPVEQIKAGVIRANMTVKQQVLSLPFRLGSQLASTTDARECSKILEVALVQCLNDLAYARELYQPPDTCPCCGGRRETYENHDSNSSRIDPD